MSPLLLVTVRFVNACVVVVVDDTVKVEHRIERVNLPRDEWLMMVESTISFLTGDWTRLENEMKMAQANNIRVEECVVDEVLP